MKVVGIVDAKLLQSVAGAAATALFAAATVLSGAPAAAQTYTPPSTAPGTKPAPAPKAAKAPAKPKPADDAATSTAASSDAKPPAGDAQLRQRVDQLEEQLVDLQVTIGTLESLARNAGSSSSSTSSGRAPAASSGGGTDNGRYDLMETQIRALTAQVEQLSDQVRAVNTGRRAQSAPTVSDAPAADRPSRPTPTPSFGAASVTPGFGASPDSDQPPRVASAQSGVAGGNLTAPATNDPGAKQLYETAYGFLLQTNYGAAEAAFDDFLNRYPNDTLSGNAQYWLGESFFVRGQFKQAASAFLKGYQTYGKGAKAPDSLLKLALSLDRLGQRDAACSSFGELTTRYPNASAPVKTRADNERRRIGC
jgi:tol-pal system protein YbgF